MNAPGRPRETLVVVPCLDEARHIRAVLERLLAEADALGLTVMVADGGSTDGTVEIVEEMARSHPALHLVENPARIQSAGINRAVDLFGGDAHALIRIDAHAKYPRDYCARLLEEARRTGADAVVVALRTVGTTPFQRGVAAAQNSILGAGDAAHRLSRCGRWVDHGHHALIRLSAFRAVGGYDASFSHNEDAELDLRLLARGGRIWLTDRVRKDYVPRDTPARLFRQYRDYGRGRARTLAKHRRLPRVRQLLPAGVVPAALVGLPAGLAAGVTGSALAGLLAAPLALWLLACLLGGAVLALRRRDAAVLWAGPAAAIMHLAWSAGFLEGLARWWR